jgi:hypothetical protein
MEEILGYELSEEEEETVKKLELLAFLETCRKHGWDKLLEKYGSSFPKTDVTDSLEDIEAVISVFKTEMEFIREEEAFLKFSNAIKTITETSTPSYTATGLSFVTLNGYLFGAENQERVSQRLYRACKEGLMGEYGKAMIAADNFIVEMRKKTEEMKANTEFLKKKGEEMRAQNELAKKQTEEALEEKLAILRAKISDVSDLSSRSNELYSGRDPSLNFMNLIMRASPGINRDLDYGDMHASKYRGRSNIMGFYNL